MSRSRRVLWKYTHQVSDNHAQSTALRLFVAVHGRGFEDSLSSTVYFLRNLRWKREKSGGWIGSGGGTNPRHVYMYSVLVRHFSPLVKVNIAIKVRF